MGAHFALEIYEGVALAALVARYRGTVLAAVREAVRSLYSVDLRGQVGFLFGNEGAGLSAELRGAAFASKRALPGPKKLQSIRQGQFSRHRCAR